MKYKLLLFDFDGTLADTEKINIKIFSELSKEYKIRKIEESEINDLKKMNVFDLIKHLEIKKTSIPGMIKKGRNILSSHMLDVNFSKPNFGETLLKLNEKNIELGILTSNSQKNVEIFLEKYDLKIFKFIISSGILGKKDKIKKIIKQYKYEKSDILYIGDEIRDIKAAQDAKVDIAVVNWGFNDINSLKKYNPDYIVRNINELIKICED